MPDDVFIHGDSGHHQDWRMVLAQTGLLFKQLAGLKSPGCPFQKYLRWLEGLPADCPIVRRVLVGVSMLPKTFRELIEPVSVVNPTMICFNLMAKTILSWMFMDDKENYKKDRLQNIPRVDRNVGNYFEYERFKELIEYVSEDGESDQRLRQIMAEYRQIVCRGRFMKTGFSKWTGTSQSLAELEKRNASENFKYLSRQMGALLGLIMLNNRSYDFGFWA